MALGSTQQETPLSKGVVSMRYYGNATRFLSLRVCRGFMIPTLGRLVTIYSSVRQDTGLRNREYGRGDPSR
jgi:hypothetical protein